MLNYVCVSVCLFKCVHANDISRYISRNISHVVMYSQCNHVVTKCDVRPFRSMYVRYTASHLMSTTQCPTFHKTMDVTEEFQDDQNRDKDRMTKIVTKIGVKGMIC